MDAGQARRVGTRQRAPRAYPFGRGWTYESASVRMLTPDVAQLSALPKAWTPGTNGPVRGRAVLAKLDDPGRPREEQGEVAGQIVLIGRDEGGQTPGEGGRSSATTTRSSMSSRSTRSRGAVARYGPEEFRRRREFRRALNVFREAEKIARGDRRGAPRCGRLSRAGGRLVAQGGAGRRARARSWRPSTTGASRASSKRRSRRARARRQGAVPRRRPDGLQHRRRDPRHRQEAARS